MPHSEEREPVRSVDRAVYGRSASFQIALQVHSYDHDVPVQQQSELQPTHPSRFAPFPGHLECARVELLIAPFK